MAIIDSLFDDITNTNTFQDVVRDKIVSVHLHHHFKPNSVTSRWWPVMHTKWCESNMWSHFKLIICQLWKVKGDPNLP